MAVLNLTPDSFYPASRFGSRDAALAAAEAALSEGADILDLGAESTRPGAIEISETEEAARLLPVLEAVRRRWPEALLSVDTRHAATARRALQAGADILNDIGGLAELGLAEAAARAGAAVIAMHMRGTPAAMHRLPPLEDPLACVRAGLAEIAARAQAAGIGRTCLALDPGFGFGKNLDENFSLLRELDALHALGAPLVAGLSRKSFLPAGAQSPPEERLPQSLAAAMAAALAGAHVIRVHDVGPTRAMLRVADRLLRTRQPGDSLNAGGHPSPGGEARPQPDQREGGVSKRWPCHPI
jgi:dihydropteroate synthase